MVVVLAYGANSAASVPAISRPFRPDARCNWDVPAIEPRVTIHRRKDGYVQVHITFVEPAANPWLKNVPAMKPSGDGWLGARVDIVKGTLHHEYEDFDGLLDASSELTLGGSGVAMSYPIRATLNVTLTRGDGRVVATDIKVEVDETPEDPPPGLDLHWWLIISLGIAVGVLVALFVRRRRRRAST